MADIDHRLPSGSPSGDLQRRAGPRWRKLDVDVATLGTWDRRLPRDKRILVPVDVQAWSCPPADAEATRADRRRRADDPAPFAAGPPRPAGVHLHWAMPDALLRGTHVEGGAGAHAAARCPTVGWWCARCCPRAGGRRTCGAGCSTPSRGRSPRWPTMPAPPPTRPPARRALAARRHERWDAAVDRDLRGRAEPVRAARRSGRPARARRGRAAGFPRRARRLHRRRLVADAERTTRSPSARSRAELHDTVRRLRLAHLARGARRRRHARRSAAGPACA